MADLKETTKQKFLKALKDVRTKDGWKVLIVDDESMRDISSCCGMYDIMEQGVTLVEPLYLRREPQPTMDAVYYLSPTEASVDCVIRDFEQNDQQYAGVHLLFTKRLRDDLFARLKASKAKNKIRSLREIYIDYLAYEQRVFHMDMHQALWNLYSPHSTQKDAQIRRLADKLLTVFATLEQEPIIRFGSGHHLSSSLATLLKERIDGFKGQAQGWPSQKKPRPILLILDRTYDMVTPFIHELTYQAMCQDLLPIQDDIYTFDSEGGGKREVLLNENDILWPTLRHKHIADTSAHLIQNFRAFIASNAAVKFKSADVNTLQDMSKVLRAMPEFQELREKYALHISLANRCIQEFGSQSLEAICYLEQALATGMDKEYKAVKSSEIARDMTNTVKKADVSMANKLRMLLLYVVTQSGLKADNIASLSATAGFGPAEAAVIDNLKFFGFDIEKLKEKKKRTILDMLGINQKPIEKAQYELSRYIPPLKHIVRDLAANALPKDDFPYLVEAEEVKDKGTTGKKPASLVPQSWDVSNNNNSAPSASASSSVLGGAGERDIIVFIIGGATFSEMRCVYDAASELGRAVFLGSTTISKPEEFVRQLQHVNDVEPPPVLRIERLKDKDRIERHG